MKGTNRKPIINTFAIIAINCGCVTNSVPPSRAAAMRSISMVGPQIMDFNHARISYDAVGEMFDNFQADIRFQILGLFDFLRDPGPLRP